MFWNFILQPVEALVVYLHYLGRSRILGVFLPIVPCVLSGSPAAVAACVDIAAISSSHSPVTQVKTQFLDTPQEINTLTIYMGVGLGGGGF